MNGKPIYFLRLVPLVLVLLLVWPPTVLVQEKKPSPAARPLGEKEKRLEDEWIAAGQAEREALAMAACRNLSEIFERRVQNRLTKQDRELIQDRDQWFHALKGAMLCGQKLSALGEDSLYVPLNLASLREEYLESRERGLAAAYNDLVDRHNKLLDLAQELALLYASPATPSQRFPWLNSPWFKPAAPIRGPVVCTGDTTVMGQGMTSIYVNCK